MNSSARGRRRATDRRLGHGTATKLGTLGGPGSGSNDLNDAGHVIGSTSTADGDAKACFWDGV